MMLKHGEIIAALTAGQKQELAASLRAFSPDRVPEGIRPFRCADISQTGGETFPSFRALANSWNAALVGKVCGALARQCAGGEAALLFVPPVTVGAIPGGDAVSEDPCLIGAYAAEISSAVRGAGALPCFRFLPDEKNAALLDGVPEPRAVYDYFLAALAYLPREGLAAVLPAPGEKENPNMAEARRALLGAVREGGVALCENAAGREAAALAEGCVLADGDAAGLEASGKDVTDEAADRAIGLSELVHAARETAAKPGATAEEIARRAAEECIVLLSNTGSILPLREGSSVAVLGAAGEEFCAALEGAGLRCAGFAPGYAPERERSDELIPPACELAAKADAAVVFLSGTGAAEELPANRLALLAEAARANPNIIAVIPPQDPCSVSFRTGVAALLVAGIESAESRAALAGVLAGRVSPGGRLAASRYDDAAGYFGSLLNGKEEGSFRIGEFVGYRRDEAEQTPAAYPFGHGLGYSEFEYSQLKILYSAAEVTVRNVGGRDAYEVVQLYVGKADSALPRPKKELKGFKKIFLRAGESATVSFPLPPSAFAVRSGGNSVTEGGVYEVSVGASSADIRLKTTMLAAGEMLAGGGDDASFYLRNRSNVLAGNYTLGRVVQVPPRGKKMLSAGKTLVLTAVLIALFIALLHFAGAVSLFNTDVFFSLILLFVCPALLIAGAVLFIVGKRRRRAAKASAPIVSDGCPAETVRAGGEKSYEELFDEAFGRERKTEERPAASASKRLGADESAAYIDPSYTIRDAESELAACCAARGISLGESGTRSLLAAFCASRLIFAEVSSAKYLPALAQALGDFFGSGGYYDDVSAYTQPADLFGAVRKEEGAQTEAARAAEYAAEKKHAVCAAVLGGVLLPPETLLGCVAGSFAATPGAEGALPPNVWLVCGAEAGSMPAAGEALAEAACSIRLDIAGTAAAEGHPVRALNYYQLLRLARKCTKEFLLDEDACWKKADRLEKAAAKASPSTFRFGNRLWLKTERYSSVLLALGAEQGEAFDGAVAACILPVLYSAGKECLPEAEKELDEASFPECRKQLDGYGV